MRLEASATAGSSYIPIVNGQVLDEGFLPGNQLRLRINIGEDSLLKAIVLGYKDSSGADRLFYNQELPGFKYHKILRVEGGDKELFNYPVRIELSRGGFPESSLRANRRRRSNLFREKLTPTMPTSASAPRTAKSP